VSIDVVLGVFAAALFAAAANSVAMPTGWWLALPLATWTIYAADHLLDARRERRVVAPHHRFHQRHAGSIGVAAVLSGAAATLVALADLPYPMLATGAVLGLLAGTYVLIAQRPSPGRLPKELLAATVYTVGIWFGPCLVAAPIDRWIGLMIAAHFMSAVANLVCYSIFEFEQDRMDDQRSIVRDWGTRASYLLVALATGVGLAASAIGLFAGPRRLLPFFVVLALLVVFPMAMLCRPVTFSARARYRVLGDLAFLTMIVPAWFTGVGG
jgi:4-hydroxybenzoate polyprenyltransferase